jgi:signal transduction histidine kinase
LNPWFVLPLVSGLACLVFGALLLIRGAGAATSRFGGLLLLGGAWWGLFEALWTLAPDAETALLLLRLSTPGWVFIGPICLELFLAETPRGPERLRTLRPIAWGTAASALVFAWTTDWIHAGMEPVPWGWAWRIGPLYAPWYVFTVLTSTAAILAALRRLRATASPAEQRQSGWFLVAVSVPMIIGSASDALLPIFGVHVPRVGVASFAVLGAVITVSIHRFGWSVIAPGSLAGVIFDAMPDGVALVEPGGSIRVANPRLACLLERSGSTLIGTRVADFLPGLDLSADPEIRERELELLRTGGTRIPVSVSTAPLRDKRGAHLGLILVVRDLGEVVALRLRLMTSARLAAVGELAAGLAHEINNPLAYINSNLRALRDQWLTAASAWPSDADKSQVLELFEDGLDMLDESLEGVERTAAIVRDVRSFSHAGTGARERLDPETLIERALRMAAPHLRSRARVVRESGVVGEIDCVRRELEQVLLNLIINAAQALDGEGTIRVRTTGRKGEVEIAVADDGCGIDPEALDRIFDPFFTTKPVGEGTGLGLSISHEIVRRHGGRLEVSSEPGRGSEFRVVLPVASGT